jgi:glucose-1-phosphate thymidylyltransferase
MGPSGSGKSTTMNLVGSLALAESFSDGENIAVILGDNTTDANISQQVNEFHEGAAVFLKEVPDPERFGVAVLDSEKKTVQTIIEKPKKPESNLAVTGLYLFDKRVFDFIKKISPSDRGELEITDVNNFYIKEGLLRAYFLDGYWRDAGTFDTLLEANNYWSKK